MSNRFTCNPKRSFRCENFSVILIHSEPRRGSSYALTKYDGQFLINYQLKVLKKAFGETVDIVIVSGYKSLDLENEIQRTVPIIINENFEETDIAHSVNLGLRATTSNAVYLIDGNSNFNEKTFVPKFESHVYIEQDGDIGLVLQNNKIINMSYGVEGEKVGKIIYLCNEDINRYIRFYSKQLLLYEIFNLMLEDGSNIWTIK